MKLVSSALPTKNLSLVFGDFMSGAIGDIVSENCIFNKSMSVSSGTRTRRSAPLDLIFQSLNAL